MEETDSATIQKEMKPWYFKPGNPGRSPGPNKLTMFLREVMGQTFAKIGGAEAFAEWAAKNRTDFYCKLWIRLLPDSSQLSDEEREKVIDAMLGVQKVITQLYEGETVKDAEVMQPAPVVAPPAQDLPPAGSPAPPSA